MEKKKYIKPLKIKSLVSDNNIFLAPMAGGSEMPFRVICRKLGAGMCFTELSTARGIRYQNSVERNFKYLEICEEEMPVAIQLFGPEPKDFEIACELIFSHSLLSRASLLDINMGCPVPKVTKSGSGASLMKDISRASEIINTCVKKSPVPVSVKFRKGWDESSINAVEFGKMCENSGASLITVHGRLAKDMYKGKADWEIIGEVKSAVGIPVIANGDITGGESAKAAFETTGADGVMIGRKALGNPWIFTEITNYLSGDLAGGRIYPSTSDRIKLIKEHTSRMVIHLGEKRGIKEMRKHFAWYLKGVPHSNYFKAEMMQAVTTEDVFFFLEKIEKKNI